MQRTVLVPLDGMPLAETALPLAGEFAGCLGARMELFRVVAPDSAVGAEDNARQYLDTQAATLTHNGLVVSTRVARGDAGECLVRQAAAEHVQLVVMTTHARAGVRRVILGSVAEHVITHAPSPVAIVRAGVHYQPHSLRTLLVPIDLSCGSPLTATLELARATGAHVVLLTVVQQEAVYVWQWARGQLLDEPQAVADARRQLEELATRMREAGVAADVRVAIGPAVACIEEVARDTEADLVIMATHARTGAPRALLGSVADGVLHAVHRPVLLFRLPPLAPGETAPIDVYHAFQHQVPAPAPESIVEPVDAVRHTSPPPRWSHLSGLR